MWGRWNPTARKKGSVYLLAFLIHSIAVSARCASLNFCHGSSTAPFERWWGENRGQGAPAPHAPTRGPLVEYLPCPMLRHECSLKN